MQRSILRKIVLNKLALTKTRFFQTNDTRFNLKNCRPQARDAKQILLENPKVTFIGIYDRAAETKEEKTPLMPAMKELLKLHYDKTGKIIRGNRMKGAKQPLTTEEINHLNENFRHYIPRRATQEGTSLYLASHQVMASRIKLKNKKQAYGFSAIYDNQKNEIQVIPDSLTFNSDKPGSTDGGKRMCPTIQKEIQQIFDEMLAPCANDSAYKKPGI